jgi:ribosome-associated heat shock protein Hsp15
MTDGPSLRLDKWLWHARFCKSRTSAQRLCQEGRVRTAGNPVFKSHHPVRAGDVLTFRLGPHVRIVRVLGLGVRRGPPAEARTLYEDLAPPTPVPPVQGRREPGLGRPTKQQRRAIDGLLASRPRNSLA